MDVLILIKAAVMGIVEGLTEFLPVSSTGHLILTRHLIDFNYAGFNPVTFEIAIQSGAMFAVFVFYKEKIWELIKGLRGDGAARYFSLCVLTAFFPAAFVGVLFGDEIEAIFFNPTSVALAFIIGGILILLVDKEKAVSISEVEDIGIKNAFLIGLAQCLALIPGTSRSGATIIGGLCFGLSRRAATEFSFYLAMPTLFGAGVYSLYKARNELALTDLPVFVVGLLFAFVSALICIKWFLKYVSTHNFAPFAVYRILAGVGILALANLL